MEIIKKPLKSKIYGFEKNTRRFIPDSNLNIKSVEHGNFIKVTADGKTLYYLIDNNLLYAFQPPMTYFDTKSTHYQKFKSLFRELILNKLGI
jgi:hypothetical protein